MFKVLYSLAIALLVVAFVGFGISAFYPAHEQPTESTEVSAAVEEERWEAWEQRFSDYNQVVSPIAIGIAMVLLVGSILWLSGLAVIGDGVTLGAVFTLFYGLIRAFMTESEVFRFIAVAIALVVVMALVYLRFVRPTSRGTGPSQGTGPSLGTSPVRSLVHKG